MNRKLQFASLLALMAALSFSACDGPESPSQAEMTYLSGIAIEGMLAKDPTIDENTNPFYGANIWNTTNIPVCWEEAGFAQEKTWVENAVTNQIENLTNINFTGWARCASRSTGIRITIQDTGPHVTALGSGLNGKRNGMVLNFTFNNWPCYRTDQQCIEIVAVHEFGHALGMSHEQNRSDTNSSNGECIDTPQGSNGSFTVGAWDQDSIMNYCSPSWNNNGRLSALDRAALNHVYGGTSMIGDWGYTNRPQFSVDVNRDNRRDYCRFVGDSPNIRLSCQLANGTNSFGTARIDSVPGIDQGYSNRPRIMADVNGDNRADFCRFVGGKPNIYLSCTLAGVSSFQGRFSSTYGIDQGYSKYPRGLFDVNGDGRADFCRFVGDKPNIYISCTLAGTSGFVNSPRYISNALGDFGYSHLPRRFIDINNDGRTDFCRYVGDKPNIRVSCMLGGTSGFNSNQNSFNQAADTGAWYNN